MNLFFILMPAVLVIIVVVFLILYFLKKKRMKKDVNLFTGEAGGFARSQSFLGGILESLLSGKGKEAGNADSGKINFSYDDEKGVGVGSAKKNQGVGKGDRKDEVLSVSGGSGEGGSEGGSKKIVDSEARLKESRKKLEEALKREGYLKDKESKTKNDKNSLAKEKKKAEGKKSGGRGEKSFGGGEIKKYVEPKKVLSELKGTDLGKILDSLKESEHSLVLKKLVGLNFSSRSDFLKALIEELAGLLKEAYKELNYRLSKIRKSGQKVEGSDIKIMSVPLKIQVFEATLSKKDYDKALSLMESIDLELKKVEPKEEKPKEDKSTEEKSEESEKDSKEV